MGGQRFETIRQAKDGTIAWLLWYYQTRMQSTLNYVSPVKHEQSWTQQTAATMKLIQRWGTHSEGKVTAPPQLNTISPGLALK